MNGTNYVQFQEVCMYFVVQTLESYKSSICRKPYFDTVGESLQIPTP